MITGTSGICPPAVIICQASCISKGFKFCKPENDAGSAGAQPASDKVCGGDNGKAWKRALLFYERN
jgi:hypothetical protein